MSHIHTLGILRPVLEGEPDLLQRRLQGDILLRPNLSEEAYLGALAQLAQEVWPTEHLSFQCREVERTVTVFTGRWNYRPVDALALQRRQIEIYGADLNKDRNIGGGGTGEAEIFASWLGRYVDSQVVIEANDLPTRLSWHLNEMGTGSEASRAAAHDHHQVLNHIQEQTGLTWSEQLRRVRRLFVELG